MKTFLVVVIGLTALALLLGTTLEARETARRDGGTDLKPQITIPAKHRLDAGTPEMPAFRSAAQGTTWLAVYTFDQGPSCVTEGWTAVDITAQPGEFFHVDDFAGLGGGDYGRLVPLEGNQSMWCGARPDANDPYLCGFASLPGYGNQWDQAICTRNCLTVTGDATIDFSASWDGEPAYDATELQYDLCDENWTDIYGGLGVWDIPGSGVFSFDVEAALHGGQLRFRFNFTSDGAWSDEDGLWNTDGAFIIDEISVTDTSGTVVPYENFEDESPGDTEANDWINCATPGYGDFAGLYKGITMVQEDPCQSNFSCVWAFVNGSTYNYACGGYPAQDVVPYENVRGQFIQSQIWSPEIPVAGTGTVWEMSFEVYRDLPLSAVVFYQWHVRPLIDGCPSGWQDYSFVFYGPGKDWLNSVSSVGSLLSPGATHVQIALGVIDMCYYWGDIYGDCLCHSHSPIFDNVSLYRIASDGPQWSLRDIDQFQDNFSADGTISGTARADMANDVLPSYSAGILPGDSATVTVNDPDAGLDFHVPGDGSSGPAVYCYVSVDGPNESTAPADLVDDPRYTVIGTQSIAGRTWTQIQMDTTWTSGGGMVADRYNIDLNDNLFVPGDTVWFFYGGRSAPPSNAWTYAALSIPTASGQTDDITVAAENPDEFTILPAAGYIRGGDVLYVDGMNFRGAQVFFDASFDVFGERERVDRYDIRGPSSSVGNHPASRVVNEFQQIIPVYRKIIWNTGDLETAFGDGSGEPDKSDDTGLLFNFLEYLPQTGGVYMSGDDVAEAWVNEFTSVSATALRSKYIDFNLVTGDHAPIVGVSPLGVGHAAGFLSDIFGPDTLVAFGGCPVINDFDVIAPNGTATLEMSYHGNGTAVGAIVADTTTNLQGRAVGFVLSGFSYHYIRDTRAQGYLAREKHMAKIINWLGNLWTPGLGSGPAVPTNSLLQNYPNPFNPTTTIRYSIAERGHVSLRVYNVAGQLVKTLVDEVRSPAAIEPYTWDGRNDAGQPVSSGVYFYRLIAKNYTQTKKMVLLK
jgi:hypothetical protein